jgi:hypothetical protein
MMENNHGIAIGYMGLVGITGATRYGYMGPVGCCSRMKEDIIIINSLFCKKSIL